MASTLSTAPSHSVQRAVLLVISVASIAFGCFISYKAIFEPPKPNFDYFSGLSLEEGRKVLGLTPHGRWLPASLEWTKDVEKFLLVLIYVFKLMCSQPVGGAGFMLILSMSMPLISFVLFQAARADTPIILRGIAVTLIFMLGQGICIGAALPIVYIPLYALYRGWDLTMVHPARAFGLSAPKVLKIIDLLSGPPAILSYVVPTTHWSWVYVNLWFQFYPLAYLLLSLHRFTEKKGELASTNKITILFESSMARSLLIYWVALYKLFPHMRAYLRGELHALNDGELLILWDALGVFVTILLVIAVDIVADLHLLDERGQPLHGTSFQKWVTGTLQMSLVSLLVGPGATMHIYLSLREESVTPLHSGKIARPRLTKQE